MDFVWKLYGNTYAVHVTVALVGVVTLNLALPAPPANFEKIESALYHHQLSMPLNCGGQGRDPWDETCLKGNFSTEICSFVIWSWILLEGG